MSKIAYSLYDSVEQQLHIFAASDNELAKDVVAAFLSKEVIPKTFQDGLEDGEAKNLLTQISESNSPQELIEVLSSWDMLLALLAV